MRRIVTYDSVSADGYFAVPDGNLNWVTQDPDLHKSAASNIEGAANDAILFGRRTYQQFESFWPHALDGSDTAENPHAAGRRSPEMRAMAEMLNNSTKLVFSRTLKSVTWKNTTLLGAFDPQKVLELKRQQGGGIIIFGSSSIVSLLTQHRLIDEYQFIVSPVILGEGLTLVRGVTDKLPLKLLEAKPYPTGIVSLRYAPAN